MDGVLADFNALARQTLRATAQDESNAAQAGRWPEAEWSRLKSVPNFYRILPKTDIADDLVQLARQFRDDLGWDIRVLTAIPKNNDMPDAFQDKLEWMQQYYPDIRVHFGPYSKDKAHHARAGDVLVDDRVDNCREWAEAGGLPVKVNEGDRKSALTQLRDIYDRKVSFRQLAGVSSTQI
jgi:hypothetical protein